MLFPFSSLKDTMDTQVLKPKANRHFVSCPSPGGVPFSPALACVLALVFSAAGPATAASEKASSQSNAAAMHELANSYRDGKGVAVDRQRAFELYTAAAAKGVAESDYELSKFYNGGSGSKVDLPLSRQHLQRAAERGNKQAQVELGFVYLNGLGVPKDQARSFKWFDAAARNGVILAQCMLGDFYRGGWGGVKQDQAKAIAWYLKTAETNDRCAPKSQYELYVSYEAGLGVPKDIGKAIRWLKRSATSGSPQGQKALGIAYQHGAGVPQDSALARKWMLKSREGVAPHDDHEHDEDDASHGHTHAPDKRHVH